MIIKILAIMFVWYLIRLTIGVIGLSIKEFIVKNGWEPEEPKPLSERLKEFGPHQ